MFTPELSAPQHIILDFPGRGEKSEWGEGVMGRGILYCYQSWSSGRGKTKWILTYS